MLCTKRLVCRNIRRKLAPLICDSCEDSGKRLGSVFRIVIALAGGWNVAEMRDSFICGINSIERTVNFYALTHKVLNRLRQLWCWLLCVLRCNDALLRFRNLEISGVEVSFKGIAVDADRFPFGYVR